MRYKHSFPPLYNEHVRCTMYVFMCLPIKPKERKKSTLYTTILFPWRTLGTGRYGDVSLEWAEGGEMGQKTRYCVGNPQQFLCLDFLKCVQIFIFFKSQICTESVSRFSRYCTDLRYWQENLDTLSVQICVLKKKKSGLTSENLDGQKVLVVSVLSKQNCINVLDQ